MCSTARESSSQTRWSAIAHTRPCAPLPRTSTLSSPGRWQQFMAWDAYSVFYLGIVSSSAVSQSFPLLLERQQYLVSVEVIAPEPSDPAEGLLARYPVRARCAEVGVRVATTGLRNSQTRQSGEREDDYCNNRSGGDRPGCEARSSCVAHTPATKRRRDDGMTGF